MYSWAVRVACVWSWSGSASDKVGLSLTREGEMALGISIEAGLNNTLATILFNSITTIITTILTATLTRLLSLAVCFFVVVERTTFMFILLFILQLNCIKFLQSQVAWPRIYTEMDLSNFLLIRI